MTTLRIFCPLLIIVATIMVSPACYTLLKHPRVGTAVDDETRDNGCASCHYEEDIWSYHNPPNHRLYVTTGDYDWGFYNAVPWWYEAYWYYTPPGPQTVPLPSRRFRPTGDTDPALGATGGPVGSPPPPKSTGGSVRVRREDDTRKGEADAQSSKKRTVRPRPKKEKKEDG
jgi:hypothetical protein